MGPLKTVDGSGTVYRSPGDSVKPWYVKIGWVFMLWYLLLPFLQQLHKYIDGVKARLATPFDGSGWVGGCLGGSIMFKYAQISWFSCFYTHFFCFDSVLFTDKFMGSEHGLGCLSMAQCELMGVLNYWKPRYVFVAWLFTQLGLHLAFGSSISLHMQTNGFGTRPARPLAESANVKALFKFLIV
jgi:hypothetical protein